MLSSLFFSGCGEDEADIESNQKRSNAKIVNPEPSQPEQVGPEEKVDEIIDAGPANAIVWEQDGAKMALILVGNRNPNKVINKAMLSSITARFFPNHLIIYFLNKSMRLYDKIRYQPTRVSNMD